MKEDRQKARQCIERATRIVGFTGAGISTESNIPDFRSPNGVWARNRTVTFQEFLASEEDRKEYWRQKVEAWPAMREALPNPGHLAFAKLYEQQKLLGLITQNIDGLHQRSGLPEETLVRLHGTTLQVTCLDCGWSIPMDDAVTRFDGQSCPRCDRCEGFLKPATISFGQSLDEQALRKAETLCRQADLLVAVGSSLVVQPAALFPLVAKQAGAALIIINREETPLDRHADVVLHGEIGRILPDLVEPN